MIEAKKKVEEKEVGKKIIEDFRKIQFEAYTEQVEKGNVSEETMEKLKNIGSIISADSEVSNYFQAEARFGVLWEDIMNILNKAVDIDS